MSNIQSPILSFIVPVYNVAPYLRKCVDSLLAQDYENYEIVLVDDGSTDESGAICDEYAHVTNERVNELTNERIRVIHQKNAGLSAARNTGIAAAKGEYICFVDSDDYWQANVLGRLMEQVELEQLDVLRFNYQNVRIKNKGVNELGSERKYEVFQPHKTGKPYFDYSSKVVDGETFLNERLGYACYAWQFILHRGLLINFLTHSFVNSFTEGIYFEDTEWTPRMLIKAKRTASTEMVVYNYLWREGSITRPDDPVKKKKVLEDKMSLLTGFAEQRKMVQNKQWFIWQTAGTTMSILDILVSYPNDVRKPYIKQLQELNVFPLSTYRAIGNNKYKIHLVNISPSLYCIIMNLLHR